jgi:iron complex transport system permease protein
LRLKAAVVLVLAAAAALVIAVRFGSQPLGTRAVMSVLMGGGSEIDRTIVLDFRLPRAFLAILVGGGLAVAGTTFQALLRNPLAEPYILGVSGGSAAGALSVIALGFGGGAQWALPVASFAGALLALTLVFRVASATGQRVDMRVLLLAGVVVGAFFMALVAFLLSVAPPENVRSAILWMMGSIAGASWSTVWTVAAYTLPATAFLLLLARPLNALSIGEETAAYLGTDVERVKLIGLVVASLITAAGVAMAGIIGFVGLIVPHGVRLLVGSDHRAVLPLSFLAGATFLTLADVLARTVRPPTEIPIGVVTAIAGVPLFLMLLRRSVGASR